MSATGPLVGTVYKVGRDKQLDPLLLLAVAAIESRYNPRWPKAMWARRALMQVMTSVHQDKFDAVGKNPLDPGAKHHGGRHDPEGLHKPAQLGRWRTGCYVGATGPDDTTVMAPRCRPTRAWRWASGIALARD